MTALFESRALAEVASDKLKIFAQPQRLMILSLLGKGEYSVGEIDAATGIGQPALSQQLAELRRAELVRTRKQAKAVYYRLADADAALCVRALEAIMGGAGDPAQQLAAVLSPAAAPAQPALSAPPGSAAFARVG